MLPVIAAMAASTAAQLASSYIGANAAEKASNQAAQSEREALAFKKQTWDTTQKNIAPYLAAGQRGLSNYETMAGSAKQPEYNYKIPDFNFDSYKDPGATYQMEQAAKALSGSSLAKGLTGGGAVKALLAKQHELAGTAYQGSFNRYLDKTKMDYTSANDSYKRNLEYQNLGLDRQKDLYTTGANMASGLGQLGNQASSSIGQSYGDIGQSQASGTLGSANAWSQGLTGMTNTLSQGLGYMYGNKTPSYGTWDGRQTSSLLGTA